MFELTAECLNAWCKEISKDYEIKSALGFDDMVFVSFDSNKKNDELFSDYDAASKYFTSKMPDELFKQVICRGYTMKVGANYFTYPTGKQQVIGYTVCLWRK